MRKERDVCVCVSKTCICRQLFWYLPGRRSGRSLQASAACAGRWWRLHCRVLVRRESTVYCKGLTFLVSLVAHHLSFVIKHSSTFYHTHTRTHAHTHVHILHTCMQLYCRHAAHLQDAIEGFYKQWVCIPSKVFIFLCDCILCPRTQLMPSPKGLLHVCVSIAKLN
jgi:hypothetical protein